MTESEPPPPPAPPPPNDGLPPSLFSSLLGDDDEDEEDFGAPMWREVEDAPIDWQERCFQLEMALHRFRDQTARIREALQGKLSGLEKKVVEAERRADEAEEKARLMEEKLQNAGLNPNESDLATPDLSKVQHVCQERDQIISKLEQQVEEQRKLRIQDAKKVEAKASKIKEWVTNKLKELEEQNHLLREQNQKCSEQLQLLRNRISQISQQRDRNNTEDSSRGSWEDHGSSDDGLDNGNSRQPCANNHRANSSSTSVPELSFHTYPPIGDVKKSWTKVTSNEQSIGQVTDSSCQVSMSNSNDCSSNCDLIKTALSSLSSSKSPLPPSVPPHSPAFSSSSSTTVNSQSSPASGAKKQHSRSLPRDAMRNNATLDIKVMQGPPTQSHVPCVGQGGIDTENTFDSSSTNYSNIYGSLDRKLKMLNLSSGQWVSCSERRRTVQTSNDLHDYAEIYTPSKEIASGFTQFGQDHELDIRPPTPPLHRFPSWESRIYEVAVNGISLSRDTLHSLPLNKNFIQKSNKSASDAYMNGSFSDMNIPVYAMVKGRASQIRSVPFTGESTDSSDNEDTRITSTHTTSGETESSASTGSPGRGGKGSLNPSPAKHSCSSPTKSVKRDTSAESVLSDDYAIPPDAFPNDSYSMDSVEPLRNSIPEHPRKDLCEKSGYLTKLGGKLKTWRRRWFVLKNGTLSYYKTQNDSCRKPQGQILLEDVCRVNRAEGASTFEVSTSKRTYYLTADSNNTMEEWIRVLQNIMRRNTTHLALSKEDNKPSIQGWVTKVKHGHSRKCWCTLVGRMFLYYKNPSDMKPLGQINMRDARVEEVLHVSDSDEEDQEDSMAKSEYTVGIFPNHQGPTYLIMPGKQEMDSWLYHLTVVSCGDNLAGTQYEQLIARMMEVDGDENSVIWRHPLLLYAKDNLTQPLTSLPSEQLQAEAVKLFKSIQLFISVPLDASGIDYHVALAQNALHQCLIQTELQNELLCQLIKQTSRHSYQKPGVQQLLLCATQSLFLCDTSEKLSPTSTTSHDRPPPPESKLNPPPFVFVQSWQLLALAISLFIPKNRTLWYLRAHLARNADTKTESGKYAIFCQRTLERTLLNGGRESKPSRMEVLSILLKNPYHHSLPHSIPVHFLNGTYQVVGFDGSTTVEEFIQTVNEEAGIRDSTHSGFALFSDDPIEKNLEHCLQNGAKTSKIRTKELETAVGLAQNETDLDITIKVAAHILRMLCDVISKWEQALREKHLGKFESTKVVKLTYKNRLCFRQLLKAETDKERLLTAYQINEDVVNGRFPLSKELSLELAALMAQIEYGDFNGDKVRCSGGPTTPQQQVQCILERFYPVRYRDKVDDRFLLDNIRDKWMSLRGRSVMDCVRIYLNCSRRWSLCGAKLFSAKTQLKQGELTSVWLGVSEDSVTLLDFVAMQPIVRYPYAMVVTFGGCRDDFMLVVCQADSEGSKPGEGIQMTERLLFAMPKPKILEITLLVADYMNAINRTAGVPPSPHASTLNRLERIRSKFRSGIPEGPVLLSRVTAETNPELHKMAAPTECDVRRGAFKKRAGSDCT